MRIELDHIQGVGLGQTGYLVRIERRGKFIYYLQPKPLIGPHGMPTLSGRALGEPPRWAVGAWEFMGIEHEHWARLRPVSVPKNSLDPREEDWL